MSSIIQAGQHAGQRAIQYFASDPTYVASNTRAQEITQSLRMADGLTSFSEELAGHFVHIRNEVLSLAIDRGYFPPGSLDDADAVTRFTIQTQTQRIIFRIPSTGEKIEMPFEELCRHLNIRAIESLEALHREIGAFERVPYQPVGALATKRCQNQPHPLVRQSQALQAFPKDMDLVSQRLDLSSIPDAQMRSKVLDRVLFNEFFSQKFFQKIFDLLIAKKMEIFQARQAPPSAQSEAMIRKLEAQSNSLKQMLNPITKRGDITPYLEKAAAIGQADAILGQIKVFEAQENPPLEMVNQYKQILRQMSPQRLFQYELDKLEEIENPSEEELAHIANLTQELENLPPMEMAPTAKDMLDLDFFALSLAAKAIPFGPYRQLDLQQSADQVEASLKEGILSIKKQFLKNQQGRIDRWRNKEVEASLEETEKDYTKGIANLIKRPIKRKYTFEDFLVEEMIRFSDGRLDHDKDQFEDSIFCTGLSDEMKTQVGTIYDTVVQMAQVAIEDPLDPDHLEVESENLQDAIIARKGEVDFDIAQLPPKEEWFPESIPLVPQRTPLLGGARVPVGSIVRAGRVVRNVGKMVGSRLSPKSLVGPGLFVSRFFTPSYMLEPLKMASKGWSMLSFGNKMFSNKRQAIGAIALGAGAVGSALYMGSTSVENITTWGEFVWDSYPIWSKGLGAMSFVYGMRNVAYNAFSDEEQTTGRVTESKRKFNIGRVKTVGRAISPLASKVAGYWFAPELLVTDVTTYLAPKILGGVARRIFG